MSTTSTTGTGLIGAAYAYGAGRIPWVAAWPGSALATARAEAAKDEARTMLWLDAYGLSVEVLDWPVSKLARHMRTATLLASPVEIPDYVMRTAARKASE